MDERVVERCVAGVQGLRVAAREARSWSTAQRHRVLGEIERLSAVLAGARAELLSAEEAARTWQRAGARSLGARVGRDTGIGAGAGQALVRQAQAWDQVPVLAGAAEAGAITTGHVEAVGRITRQADAHVREILTSPQGQQRLVQLAKGMDVPTFTKELARSAAALDPVGPDRELERQRAARFFHLSDGAQGTRLSGLLDHRTGRHLRLALEAVSPRPGAEDDRTAPQRGADALGDLAEAVLSMPETGSGAASRPHVSLIMSVETLAELRQAQARRTHPDPTTANEAAANRTTSGGESVTGNGPDALDSTGTAEVPGATDGTGTSPVPATTTDMTDAQAGAAGGGIGVADATADRSGGTAFAPAPSCTTTPARPWVFDRPVDPVTDEDGHVVPLTEVARALCDCLITRIALDAVGEPVDLGRSQRLYTGAQRRAVHARDRGCAWPGCTIPARWCEIHHIWWWDRDEGPTSVDNGVALCSFHHHEVHRRDLHLIRQPADLPPGVGRGVTGGLDPGRPTVRYTIHTRDGTTIAGRPPDRHRVGHHEDDGHADGITHDRVGVNADAGGRSRDLPSHDGHPLGDEAPHQDALPLDA